MKAIIVLATDWPVDGYAADSIDTWGLSLA